MTSFSQGPPPTAGEPAKPRFVLIAGCTVLVLALFGGAMWLGRSLIGSGEGEDSTMGVPAQSAGLNLGADLGALLGRADFREASGTGDSHRQSDGSQDDAQTTDSSTAPEPSPSSASPTQTAQSSARRTLEELADEGSASVSLDGRHVAMLASKWNGVRDPLQKSASGSHVFHYSDIVAEHEALVDGDNYGATIVLLRSTDYGKRAKSPNGKVMYVTFAYSADFTSTKDVERWCERRFSDLSDKERANNCVPTRLTD